MSRQDDGKATRARASERALSAALNAAKDAGYKPTKMIVRGAIVEIYFGETSLEETVTEEGPDVGLRRLKDW